MPPIEPRLDIKQFFRKRLQAETLKAVIDSCHPLSGDPEEFRYYKKDTLRKPCFINSDLWQDNFIVRYRELVNYFITQIQYPESLSENIFQTD